MKILNKFFESLDLKILALIGLFVLIIFNLTYTDGDFFWQFKIGQYIFENHSLPPGDIFSYTKEGQPWVIQEWGYEFIIYAIYHLFDSMVPLKIFISSLSILFLYLNYNIAKQFTNDSYLPFFIGLIFWIPSTMGIAFRPHMLTYLFFLITLRILLHVEASPKTRIIWWLPLIMFLWVNVHAAFIVGIVLLMIFLLAQFVHLHLSKNFQRYKKEFYTLTICVVISLLATLINPYFIYEWIFPFKLMSLDAIQNHISEWQSPDFHSIAFKSYLILIFTTLVLSIHSKRKPNLFITLLFFIFLFAGFVAQRHIPIAGFAMTPFAAIVAYHFPYKSFFKNKFFNGIFLRFNKFKSLGGELGKKEFFMNWIILTLIFLFSIAYYPEYKILEGKEFNRMFPVKETEFIIDHQLKGKMLNDVNIGGYLIYKLYPSQKVFYDGRIDFYGNKFSKEYFQMVGGGPDWEKLFNSYHFDYVLLKRQEPLRQLLLMRGDYKLAVDSKNYSLLISNSIKFE
jgi:hypothetical protein